MDKPPALPLEQREQLGGREDGDKRAPKGRGVSCDDGDDALALTIAHLTKWRIARAYLLTDITVLVLSLSYIPVSRIVFSLVTVTVSSFLIDFIQSRGACREGAEA